jgi:hypothetical protein
MRAESFWRRGLPRCSLKGRVGTKGRKETCRNSAKRWKKSLFLRYSMRIQYRGTNAACGEGSPLQLRE